MDQYFEKNFLFHFKKFVDVFLHFHKIKLNSEVMSRGFTNSNQKQAINKRIGGLLIPAFDSGT